MRVTDWMDHADARRKQIARLGRPVACVVIVVVAAGQVFWHVVRREDTILSSESVERIYVQHVARHIHVDAYQREEWQNRVDVGGSIFLKLW